MRIWEGAMIAQIVSFSITRASEARAWINDYIPSKTMDKISYRCPNIINKYANEGVLLMLVVTHHSEDNNNQLQSAPTRMYTVHALPGIVAHGF